jgi:hypothetical protein
MMECEDVKHVTKISPLSKCLKHALRRPSISQNASLALVLQHQVVRLDDSKPPAKDKHVMLTANMS